jgi:hypothetical protein
MKALVITKDSATRLNTTLGEVIDAFRPSVVTVTEFVKTLAMSRCIEPLGGELPDSATDAEFEKFWKESDKNVDLAISSFLSFVHNRESSMFDEEQRRLNTEQEAEAAAGYAERKAAEEAQAQADKEAADKAADESKKKFAEIAAAAAAQKASA